MHIHNLTLTVRKARRRKVIHGLHFINDVPGCSNIVDKIFTVQGDLAQHKRSQPSKDGGRHFPCGIFVCRKHKRTQHSEDGGHHFPCDAPAG